MIDHINNWLACKPLPAADTSGDTVEEREVIVGIVTDIDLLQYISRAEAGNTPGSGASPGTGQ